MYKLQHIINKTFLRNFTFVLLWCPIVHKRLNNLKINIAEFKIFIKLTPHPTTI